MRKLASEPDKRVISSDWDVFLEGKWLLYVKNGCRQAKVQPKFFLHVTPVDQRDLPQNRRRGSFDNLDFPFPSLPLDDKTCAILRRLPTYPIRQIRTGQFVKDAQGSTSILWEGKFVMEHLVGGVERQAGN